MEPHPGFIRIAPAFYRKGSMIVTDEIGGEQEYVSMLYGRLDSLRSRASDRLARVLQETGGTHQARSEREAFSAMYTQQLSQFDAAENGLCFRRRDFRHGERPYIGRV